MILFLLVHHHGSKMLRSESNSSITQSPIGWQISHFLTLLHEPTSGMCVCTSECVLLALAPVCHYSLWQYVCVCELSSWMASPHTSSTHNQLSFSCGWFFLHAVSMWVTSPAVIFSEALFWEFRHQISLFFYSQHVARCFELSFFCSFQVCLTINQTNKLFLRSFERLKRRLSCEMKPSNIISCCWGIWWSCLFI